MDLNFPACNEEGIGWIGGLLWSWARKKRGMRMGTRTRQMTGSGRGSLAWYAVGGVGSWLEECIYVANNICSSFSHSPLSVPQIKPKSSQRKE
jgi:hypothetical protein